MARSSAASSEGSPGFVAAGIVAVATTATYAASGALWPGDLPGGFDSSRQVVGMALMLIVTPAYLLVAWTIGQRRSLELVEELRPQLPDPAEADRASVAIRSGLRRTWIVGTLVGVAFGLLNTQPYWALYQSPVPRISLPISLGQILLWCIVGNLLTSRIAVAQAFARLGEFVPIDLFRLGTLRPLARAGLIDVVIVVGALLFAPLQSLDAEFRSENYRFALSVALPALAFLLIWPLRSVHRRIRADRDERLARVEAQIDALGPDSANTADGMRDLELLLAHRTRLLEARTWPLDLRLLSRFFLYLIIPPLAWVAAAIVERFVDAMMVGP